MPNKTLVPDAAALHLEELRSDDEAVTMVVTTTGDAACCPDECVRTQVTAWCGWYASGSVAVMLAA